MNEKDLIKAELSYPNLDFTTETYIEDFDSDAEPGDVIETVEDSDVLDHWNGQALMIADWDGAMDLLSEDANSVKGVVGNGRDFDRVFEHASFDIDGNSDRDTIVVECKEGGRRWLMKFESEDIDIRHEKVFENEDEEMENTFDSGQDAGWMSEVINAGDAFRNELTSVHFERLDKACYFIGGDDSDREDVYHKLWLMPSSDSTTLRYTIHLDQ